MSNEGGQHSGGSVWTEIATWMWNNLPKWAIALLCIVIAVLLVWAMWFQRCETQIFNMKVGPPGVSCQAPELTSSLPIGGIVAWPAADVPDDYKLCDGAPLKVAEYGLLFKVIGTKYGGDGRQYFNLPDYRGRFLRGLDKDHNGDPTNPARDPDREKRQDPLNGSVRGNDIGSLELDEIKEHAHIGAVSGIVSNPANHPNQYNQAGGYAFNESGTGPVNQTNNVRAGEETRPVNVSVQWIIRVR